MRYGNPVRVSAMKLKPNYAVIPVITLAVALAGIFFTLQGVGPRWYSTIMKPDWTPPDGVFGGAWTVIFILAAISAIIVWNTAPRDEYFHEFPMLFGLNALLNVLWGFLFFTEHLIGLAVLEAAFLGLETALLSARIWPKSKTASLLLLPYVLWVAFAAYLTYAIWVLN